MKVRVAWPEAVLLLGCTLTLLPLLVLVWDSLKSSIEIIAFSFPGTFSLDNYKELFFGTGDFGSLFVNSVLVCVFTVLAVLVIGSPAAYALSKFKWPHSFTVGVLGFALLIQAIPPVTLAPSFYVLLTNAHFYNTLFGLIAVNTVFNLPFGLILMKVFFDEIPTAIGEAALVDGASSARTFVSVMLPLAVPGIAATAILVAILTWNEFLMALTLTSTAASQTLPIGIAGFVQEARVAYGPLSAAAAAATIPVVVLAVFANRYIVSGLTRGAVKG